ncbi:MAG: hypothetical protein A2505_05610 [Deltaproteobacteria bacterium RIFOXYD12_FULL_55_16]|nr:MAG: hypothetical protein A2505_05610 [Deltaproteobacteria bacterium RIFOXYD12_FULL_55_16]
MRPLKFRYDIQALRGFAVLGILFYHAKLPLFSAGFLGVDVFFVISGFLITSLIRERIEQDSFSFIEFYFRRAKRLLPAAYVTLLITALLAPVFLASSEMNDFRAQMCGAVTFMSNVVFWRQSGYFEGVAELKPLLHTWSLAIEEQYYFVLPALMFFTPRRRWFHIAILGFIGSFALCIFMVQWKADVSFYLLPTRWWGFAIGSIGALIPTSERLDRVLQGAFWPALLALLVLPTVKISNPHPGLSALLICIATLLIILRKHPFLFHTSALRGVVKTGDISYSLYLVHWPLFAFLNNSWLGNNTSPPFLIRMGIMFLSFILAWILNRCIEEPFRKPEIKLTRKLLALTVASSLFLFLLPIGIIKAVQPEKNYAHLRRANLGFGRECVSGDSFIPIPECRNSDQPEILVWGDSFAMHLVPGLIIAEEDEGPTIIQATRSVCGPLLGVAPTNVKYNQEWAKKCLEFNESVVSYLAEANSVKTVVISSPFRPYLSKHHWSQDWSLLKKNHSDDGFYLVEPSLTEAIAGTKKTVDAVRSLGKRVVVVAPPPSSDFDIGRCLERLERGLPILGAANECQIDVKSWKKTNSAVLEFLAVLSEQANVEVINFSDFLCDSISCKTQNENIFIYRDAEHLSYDGSSYLADKIRLTSQIQKLAK